ncbi:MAG: transglycosylase domain-containing protein [Spirochaetes bacterium]|nr:transglycosylase domain-containing protein [Spirochaetota bacterium]
MLKNFFHWIISHKIFIFVYIPLIIIIISGIFAGTIYLSWLEDRDKALETLSRYKKLIDRTEELKSGQTYSYSQIDLSAKVVDIPTRIYDRNNEIIGEYFEQKREIVPYASIPQWLVKAVIASEDRAFYNHSGLSYKGIFRAVITNIINMRVVQGGSTITQQLAKVLFTDMEREFKRKIYEAFCALEIEKRYDKQDILSMYLNLIYFGNGAYGVESASKMFFGMSVKDLDETECAMVVATIANPLIYSPLLNLKNALIRTKAIMRSMIDAGFIEEKVAEYQSKRFITKWDFSFNEKKEPETSLIGSFLFSSYKVNRAPFFNESIRRVLSDKFGEDVLKKGGLSVYTTIDGKKQDIALKALQDGILKQKEYHKKVADENISSLESRFEEEKANNIDGALVAIDPHTGEIITYAGGYAFSTKSQLDLVSQIVRQPGSSFKPVIYAAALENRTITPSSVFIDEKTEFKGDYSPKNYNDVYTGKVIVREALRKSINVIAVKVLEETGYETVFRILRDALDLPDSVVNKRFGQTLSLALGTYEISPLENCVLHSTIVNGGKFIQPYGIKYVKDYNGNIVWHNEKEVMDYVEEKRNEFDKIIDPVACAITVSMLKGVFEPEGTAYFAFQGARAGFPAAGKTGTSSDFCDAWFAGYTADLVTVVWIGNKAGAISLGKGRAGGVVAAPVWARFVSQIYADARPGEFAVPGNGVTRQTICLESGMVPRKGNLCPKTVVDELYYAGSEPGEFCNIHLEKRH